MESSRFDALTRSLATRTTRRQTLKAIAAISIGELFGLRGVGTALADNSVCAHFCAAVFGADTAGAGRCTSDAAHQSGLCYSCGPASPGGTQPICCPQNPDGTCASYGSVICCISGQICQSGQCVTPVTTTTSAPAPTTTTPAPVTTTSTTAAPPVCPAGSTCESQCPGSTNPNCLCGTTTAGLSVCYNDLNGCAGGPCSIPADCTATYGSASTCISGFCSTPSNYCNSDSDCAAGSACVNLNDGCGGCDLFTGGMGICQPICTS